MNLLLKGLVPVFSMLGGGFVAYLYSHSPLVPRSGGPESGETIAQIMIGGASSFMLGAYLGALAPRLFLKTKLDYYPLAVALGVSTGLFAGLMIPLYGGPFRFIALLTAYFGGRLAVAIGKRRP